jgi:phosphoribosylamine---glycine ligase
MHILLLGSGGREHALAWKIAASPLVTKLWCAPGNAGIAREAECVGLDIADHEAVIDFCKRERIEFVVVGPETPLAAGIVDDLARAGIKAFGPSRQASRLEGSKGFTKALCTEFGIPTGAYGRFTSAADALAYVRQQGAPIVVKADGLAAGKGVVVAMTLAEAEAAIAMMFDGAFGAAGTEVVIEEYLAGREISFFALSDGDTAIALASAQDHKRVFDHDRGPNTGGMGAYSPTPFVTDEIHAEIMAKIILPTVNGMKARGAPFRGVLYAGVMLTAEGPKLFEYNVRFGDPECQVLMLRMMSDLVPAMLASSGSGADGGDGGEGLSRRLPEGHTHRGSRRRRENRGRRDLSCRHDCKGRTDPRQWRPRAECLRERQDDPRSPAARLCGGRSHPVAGRLLPPRHRLAGGGAGEAIEAAEPGGTGRNFRFGRLALIDTMSGDAPLTGHGRTCRDSTRMTPSRHRMDHPLGAVQPVGSIPAYRRCRSHLCSGWS